MLEILARRELFVPANHVSRALLLEGSWPEGLDPPCYDALDDAIDGRFDWIDALASAWAEQLAGELPMSAAYLNALALRYYLVRPLRLAAYFMEVAPLARGEEVRLTAGRQRDADYAAVLQQLCSQAGAVLSIDWIDESARPEPAFPPNARWRRLASRVSRLLDRPAAVLESDRPRVVLCGNPRLLDPVCRELLNRGVQVWWLYDRFAVNSWMQWRRRGVGQLVCNSSLGRENRLELPAPGGLTCRGVDLGPVAAAWLARRVATQGARQTRLVEQIDRHFHAIRPQAVVLDEDATPTARAAVAAARRQGAVSLVVQHGLPVCRFGFAPLAADRVLVWGRSSQQILAGWGVPPERIHVTGGLGRTGFNPFKPSEQAEVSTTHHAHRCAPAMASGESSNGLKPVLRTSVLLLAIRPPQVDRPDAVALHLTPRTYAAMIRAALEAMAGLEGAKLIVKVHPRAGDDPAILAARKAFPELPVEIVSGGPLDALFRRVGCAVSCGSTAGVEAALAGLPVVALTPPRASAFPTHETWGLAGTAHDAPGLAALIEAIFAGRLAWQPPGGAVVAANERCWPERIADLVVDAANGRRVGQARAASAGPP